jgi:hypothetical protein
MHKQAEFPAGSERETTFYACVYLTWKKQRDSYELTGTTGTEMEASFDADVGQLMVIYLQEPSSSNVKLTPPILNVNKCSVSDRYPGCSKDAD